MTAPPHFARPCRRPLGALAVLALLAAPAAPVAGGLASGESALNRLAGESSPYLRLHASNPVDWYPWDDEALERARREDRPIFLSVGYSTCYWCHVMEREVFSDPEIAALMNRWFVNVKVDREERPELDEIYMAATQLMTGAGGWPNSVFLTPELEPFFAGTYFPPEDRHGRPGFPTVLRRLSEVWAERRGEVRRHAARVAEAVRTVVDGGEGRSQPPSAEAFAAAAAALAGRYDAVHGGFGSGQKFPSPASLLLLWERGEAGDPAARDLVLETLRRMGRGAIYDQLAGGFHRYTLDPAWRIPHFEKMLYDNAHLAELLAVSAAASGDPELERLARGTIGFVLDTFALPEGGFKSAIDSQNDGVEGAFYVWSGDELRRVLGEDDFALLAPIFGFDGEPNFEGGHYTLYLTAPLAEHAESLGLDRGELAERLDPGLERLRRARAARPWPLIDDKVLADWNGMMIAALARAGKLLEEPGWVEAAARAADFVLAQRDAEGTLLHSWRGGEARIRAFLDDYAFLIRGLLELHRATGEARWLGRAEGLAAELERRLAAPEGGYYMSEADARLPARPRPVTDGAVPSGNGVAILGLLELARRTGEPAYRQRAAAALGSFAPLLSSNPAAAPTAARGARRLAEMAAEPLTTLAESVVDLAARWLDGETAAGWRPLEVELGIRDGWHLNANPASLEFLIPTRLEGEVRRAAYPAGESQRFAFADEALSVYSGRVRIAAELPKDEGRLSVTYQACDERRCLPPVTRRLEVEP